ncbi:MAG: ABC transporter substrate-binding protein, partial [Olsenella sp.]|nr:ABC transporter substrate-binding protein [Olsenella sp.]
MLKNTNLTRRQALAALGSITAGLAFAACGTSQTQSTDTAATEDVTARVASLKGPTAIGLVSMMDATSGVPTEDAPTEPA